MRTLIRTDVVETTEDLMCTIVWDDDEDPEKELRSGVYKTCGGEWRHEDGEKWRLWEDPTVAAELRGAT